MSLFSANSTAQKKTNSSEDAVGPVSTIQEFDDGRSFDPVAVHQSTQRWIATHMKKRLGLAKCI